MNIEKHIKNHGLRYTENRAIIAEALYTSNHALSYFDLRDITKGKLDKVTIYRTLKSFEDSGIIHTVNDHSGILKYAFCNDDCSHEGHTDNHLHFKCSACEKVYCIDNSKPFLPKLPKGFSVKKFELLLEGKCPECSN